jgi:hypothetical protein
VLTVDGDGGALAPTTALVTGLLGLALFVPVVVGANAVAARLLSPPR